MEQKKILGLDLGTNSIGAALISIPASIDDFGKGGEILWLGSRIIPVDADYLQKFESGAQVETKAAARRMKRGTRRLKHRYKLRRTRLIQVFKILGWVNEDFPEDFKKQMNDDESFKFKIDDHLPFSNETIEEATELLGVKGKRNKRGNPIVSPDWIVYYLRKKALTKKITLQELARIFYMMNQRRGFESSRKDLKETTTLNYNDFKKLQDDIHNGKSPEYQTGNGEEHETKFVAITKIISIVQKDDGKDRKGNYTFEITAQDKRLLTWTEQRKKKPDWEGKEFTLVVTQKIDSKGNLKQNKPQFPTDDDWELTMVALDNQIDDSSKHPGEFFFDKLCEDKNYKIRQYTVRRKKYKKELAAIWSKQLDLRVKEKTQQEMLNDDKLPVIATALYKHNQAKQKELNSNGLFHILSDDIIYYQRDPKSQKNSIGECRYEKHKGIDGEYYGVKCAPKSSPEFQEFRIWQDIHNLRIFEKEQNINGQLRIDVDVTRQSLDDVMKEKLFELFDGHKEVSEKQILEEINKHLKGNSLSIEKHRINLFANRDKLLGNETKELFRKIFKKHDYEAEGEKLLADRYINPSTGRTRLEDLWHGYYSENSVKGMRTVLSRLNFPPDVVDAFARSERDQHGNVTEILPPELKKQYASYSSKAIRKLLPLMRCGKYWNWDAVDPSTKERIEKILKDGWEQSFAYDKRTGELIKEREFTRTDQFSGLPVWFACYVAYGRHSERESDKKYEKPEEMDVMKLVPNNILRNPIVEQVIRETLLLIRDAWKRYGQPDEIHIELGRELKKNALEKERIAKNNSKNFEEKQRIKKLLSELRGGKFESYADENNTVNAPFEVSPNPESPADIEKFRIYKSCAAITYDEEQDHWETLFKGKKEPTNAEIKKYALWLSQQCASPYTGKIISLTKLFSEEYEVEHIIPRRKLKNDSFDNLVICERGVNKLKDNDLATVFIANHDGAELEFGGKKYKLLPTEEYFAHCKNTFRGRKLKNLLATEVPEDFVQRQINDMRYITRKISELLYTVAKDKNGLVFTIGSITSELKGEWGLHTIWKELLKPRFERLEKLTDRKLISEDEENPNKFHFHIPDQPNFEPKRLDHRHHALDALIIAATTREHIRYLNSLSAVDSSTELQQVKRALVKRKFREFKLPWQDFTKDAKEKLSETIVTFKTNTKIVSKPANKYVKWVQKNGVWKKEVLPQKSKKRWLAVRKSMFKEPQGIIFIKEKRKVSVFDAFKIQIDRMKVEHDNGRRRTTSYVYDKLARQYVIAIIKKVGVDIDHTDQLLAEIKNYLQKNKRANGYSLEGKVFEKIQIAEFVEVAAKRVAVDASFTEKKIEKIPYPNSKNRKKNIATLLQDHLKEFRGKPTEAFQGEGLEVLMKSNAGRKIEKVTIKEEKSPEYKVGNKYLEPDKGAIAYFVMYENEASKERSQMYSLATHKAIERLVAGEPIADKREGFKTIVLSPGDLVYVPTEDEARDTRPIDWNDRKTIAGRIYRMVKSTGKQCFFVPANISNLIIPYDKDTRVGEIESQNCSERTLDGETQIKKVCIKIKVDRLGNIIGK
jgi:CRISPR-associated endonuclease Csn1